MGISDKKAFTFVELMIALAITGAIVSVVYNFFFFVSKSSDRGTAHALAMKKIRNTMAKIERDIRMAREIKEIKPDILEVDTYVSEKVENEHVNLSGDSMKINVRYELRQKDGKDALYRIVDHSDELKIMEFSKIELPIFMAKTYNRAGELVTFDFRQNDSFERERISLINLTFSIRERDDEIKLRTSVFVRSISGLLDRPYWQKVK